MILLQLFLSFAKVGVLTFGGGYAMIPLLEREIVEKRRWASSEELMDYYAVGQCTPGVIAVNTATFIGYKTAGNLGGIVATLGVVFPSFVIITVIAGIIRSFADIPAGKGAIKDKAALALCLLVFVLSLFFDISPIVFVVLCAAAGILFTKLGVRGK